MFNRLNREEYACLLAFAAAARSEDPFTQTGACLLDEAGNVLGTGTNGLAPGMCLPNWMNSEVNRGEKSKYMLHAEPNLFVRKKEGVGHLLGVTISPCLSCAKLIASTTIKHVVYIQPYVRGDKEYEDIFKFYGITHMQLSSISREKISNYIKLFESKYL